MSVIFTATGDDSQGFAGRPEDDLSECFKRVFATGRFPLVRDFAQHLKVRWAQPRCFAVIAELGRGAAPMAGAGR